MREEASYLSQEETVVIARKPLRGYKCAPQPDLAVRLCVLRSDQHVLCITTSTLALARH